MSLVYENKSIAGLFKHKVFDKTANGLVPKPFIDNGTTFLADDGTWKIIKNEAKIDHLPYTMRSTLRQGTYSSNDIIIIDDLGLFHFEENASYIDDDTFFFQAENGFWKLQLLSFDLIRRMLRWGTGSSFTKIFKLHLTALEIEAHSTNEEIFTFPGLLNGDESFSILQHGLDESLKVKISLTSAGEIILLLENRTDEDIEIEQDSIIPILIVYEGTSIVFPDEVIYGYWLIDKIIKGKITPLGLDDILSDSEEIEAFKTSLNDPAQRQKIIDSGFAWRVLCASKKAYPVLPVSLRNAFIIDGLSVYLVRETLISLFFSTELVFIPWLEGDLAAQKALGTLDASTLESMIYDYNFTTNLRNYILDADSTIDGLADTNESMEVLVNADRLFMPYLIRKQSALQTIGTKVRNIYTEGTELTSFEPTGSGLGTVTEYSVRSASSNHGKDRLEKTFTHNVQGFMHARFYGSTSDYTNHAPFRVGLTTAYGPYYNDDAFRGFQIYSASTRIYIDVFNHLGHRMGERYLFERTNPELMIAWDKFTLSVLDVTTHEYAIFDLDPFCDYRHVFFGFANYTSSVGIDIFKFIIAEVEAQPPPSGNYF